MKSPRILAIDDLKLDLAARRVFRDAEEIELGRLTFDLFAALARAAPAALSSDEIVAQVWDTKVVSDETLKQRVSLLRRALGRDSSREYVQTVRGFGYRLATEPVPLDEPGSPAPRGGDLARAEAEMPTLGPASAPGARLLRALLITLAILAVLIALTLVGIVARQAKRWTPDSFSSGRLVDPTTDPRLHRRARQGPRWQMSSVLQLREGAAGLRAFDVASRRVSLLTSRSNGSRLGTDSSYG